MSACFLYMSASESLVFYLIEEKILCSLNLEHLNLTKFHLFYPKVFNSKFLFWLERLHKQLPITSSSLRENIIFPYSAFIDNTHS